MTNTQAINLLQRISLSQHDDEKKEALEMAVRALEPNLGNNGSICAKTGGNDEDRTTGDCISRKMAIDAIEEMQMPIMRSEWLGDQYKFSALAEVREKIDQLPSAQQEIIRCKDCKYYRKGHDDVYYCQFHDDDILWQDDDYCSYGKMEVEHEL